MTQTSDTTTPEAVRATLARWREMVDKAPEESWEFVAGAYAALPLLLDALEAANELADAVDGKNISLGMGFRGMGYFNTLRHNASNSMLSEATERLEQAAESYRATLAAIAATLEGEGAGE